MKGVPLASQFKSAHWALHCKAYGPIEAVAVVVQLSSFFEKIKLDPVVETRHLSSLDLSYEGHYFLNNQSKKMCKTSVVFGRNLLCPNLQRCVQSRWSPSCCCCVSTDQTTSSSDLEWTLPLTHRCLKIQNNKDSLSVLLHTWQVHCWGPKGILCWIWSQDWKSWNKLGLYVQQRGSFRALQSSMSSN